ncbi:MAG: HEPN domain-containing protein [Chryseobacterium sp.]|nr:MAG: HEPN domain-containing protein [Chryseobacterium sp.]
MKTSLSHLDEGKQEQIEHIVHIIKEEANPEKIILFGSHAKGNWIDDAYIEDGIHYTYISDYDFLVVIKKENHKESQIISNIQNRCKRYHNDVMPIIHDIDYINQGLRIGQYFFTDIISEGILLYDTRNYEFLSPAVLTPSEEKERAEEYFNIWYPQAIEFLIDTNHGYNRGSYRKSAFELHQATECLFCTALLVYTGYKPKTHNLEKLRSYAKYVSVELYSIFLTPDGNEHEKYLFDLLKRGYIDARYKKEYLIEGAELKELIGKIEDMQQIVKSLCEKRINSFNI